MTNGRLLQVVAGELAALDVDVVFFGGTVVGLHLDEVPSDDEERPTIDVDCVPAGVGTQHELIALEGLLDRSGWRHRLDGAKRNAWARLSPLGVQVDFVPLIHLGPDDPVRLGRRVEHELPGGTRIQVLAAGAMLAAKFRAFDDRGRDDPLMSADLEDLAMLLSCCSFIEAAVANEVAPVRAIVAHGAASLLDDSWSLEVLDGNVPRGADAAETIRRLERLATAP